MRGDSRSLIFEGDGITLVTMRPSDVPTYVEAGAADVGITGKDVLLEQSDRVVYELLDLGFGRCRMVLAGRKGDERLGESQRRLGMMRIATKYPRIAERHFEGTGRQVEVIEVKGSVELAPLIGLGDGIVDLVATGRTLEENDLEVREEIVECTARFVANRVAHKLRAAEVDELTAKLREASGAMRARRFEWEGRREDRGRDPGLGLGVGARGRRRRDRARSRRGRRRGRAAADRALRRDRSCARRPCGSTRASPRRRWRPRPGLREAMEVAAANIRAVAEAQVEAEPREVELPQGQTVTIREVPVGAAGIYAPGGRAAYPSSVLMCAIPARVAGVGAIALASPPGPDGRVAPAGPGRRRALRGRRDLRDGRRPGDLRPRPRHRDDRARST